MRNKRLIVVRWRVVEFGVNHLGNLVIGRIHIRRKKVVTDGIPSDRKPSDINLRTENRLMQ